MSEGGGYTPISDGMAIAFNARIKTKFGFSVSHDMTEAQCHAITRVRTAAAKICVDGLANSLEKKVIIAKIWVAVDQIGESHQQLERLLA